MFTASKVRSARLETETRLKFISQPESTRWRANVNAEKFHQHAVCIRRRWLAPLPLLPLVHVVAKIHEFGTVGCDLRVTTS